MALLKSKLKNYKLAEEYCLKSLAFFKQNKSFNNLRKSLEQLAIIYNLEGKHQKAYNMYIKATNLKDRLFCREKIQKIAQLEEKYLSEKQIQKLKYENSLKQSEISQQKKLRNIYLLGFIMTIIAVVIIYTQFRKKNMAYKFLVKKNIDILNNEKELKNIREQVIVNKLNYINATIVKDDKKEEILRSLNQLFEIDKIFKDHDLTIDKLAKKISTNRNYLSQIINENFGKNYSDFINEYRIKESILLFSNPQKTFNLSIAGIAKEAGFWSIPRFNHAFKKFTGITPSDFRNNIDILKK